MPTKVRELLHADKPLLFVRPATTVLDTSQQMMRANVGAALVLSDTDQLIGIFTERDLLRRVVTENRDPATTAISAVMTPDVIVASVDDSHEELIQVMNRTKCRHIPVVEGDRLRGVVSMRDVLRYDNAEKDFEMNQLRAYFFNEG